MIAAIVQARMGSTRLPGKVLADIAGVPMLAWVLKRLAGCQAVDKIMVATSDTVQDDVVAEFCKESGMPCYRGSQDDVLDRYFQAATMVAADAVVRITADCPLLDPEVVDKVVREFLETPGCDYASNTVHYTYPDGLDAEVFTYSALKKAWENARSPLEREHVTTYIKTKEKNGTPAFSVLGVEHEGEKIPPGLRWTVDTQEDMEFVRAVYSHFAGQQDEFGFRDVLDLLENKPELKALNDTCLRNEGLYKSLLQEEPMPAKDLRLANSSAFKERAGTLIPSGSQTFSKGPSQFIQGVSPVFLERGDKSHVWDVDGNEYIDCILGLGPVILGYNDYRVRKAVEEQAVKGASFSLPHILEVEVAEMLVDFIPCAEMVRFGKNGSDATSGAVRAARAYTGRDLVVCCGYHGWQDWYIGTTTRNIGVPEVARGLTKTFPYNNLAALKKIFDRYPNQIAAVIMEPVSVEEPHENFLQSVKKISHENGALLIFDEVITGFRLAKGGAQEYFGVTPDMACFGKAMANGYPLSAVVGTRDVMEVFDDIFYSFTFGGEAVSLAAAKATLETFRQEDVIGILWEQGARIKEGFTVLAEHLGLADTLRCKGLPPRTVIEFNPPPGFEPLVVKSVLQQEMVRRGVLWAGYHNVCFSMSEADVLHILKAYRASLPMVKKALQSENAEQFLLGPAVSPLFRKV